MAALGSVTAPRDLPQAVDTFAVALCELKRVMREGLQHGA
jgi:hypothetical protein